MKLADYLAMTKETQVAFGLRAGVSHNHVSQICAGKKCPSLPLAHRIVTAADGLVDYSDLLAFENDEAPGPEAAE